MKECDALLYLVQVQVHPRFDGVIDDGAFSYSNFRFRFSRF